LFAKSSLVIRVVKKPVCKSALGLVFSLGMVCGFSAMPVPAASAEIHLVTESYPPLNFLENGEIAGIGADQVREIMKREGIGYTIRMVPWARAYWLAENRKNHCVFTTAITPDRAENFAWISPLGGAELFLVKKTGANVPDGLGNITRSLSVGSVANDYTEEALRANGFAHIDYFDDVDGVLNQLFHGRLDLAALSSITFFELVRQGIEVEKVHGFGKLVGNGLACHPQTDADLIHRMRSGLEKIIADGFQAEVWMKYAGELAEDVAAEKR